MENICQLCKLIPGLLVKRGDSLPITICLQCLHLDAFGSKLGSQKEIEDEVLEREPILGEYFIITEFEEDPTMATCRVCLGHNENMINIFDNTLESGIPIATLISQSTGLGVAKGDSFPETVCPTCLLDAHNGYEYHKLLGTSSVMPSEGSHR
ncbi:uncharacterized protein LOC108053435 [Drosophila rhopaloa]|uniref:Uncharacterized protein LOC108053435 n=1 Tax=Drosophila rhopaloa TaxID=1041015 RepID=A0A6P4FPA0_DRORH|nr:uncharacterized protein LOC108053435 [Drosophila rhopaloa]XP_016991568.1 uncharacterized protein LOC108053435 [Drosophila rhopaloa]XP_016991569.1 uncharacterized protein LOC108053435 [Drosophila rhopaloa]